MSARINLLPHREERRKRARQHFFVIAGGTAVIGILIVVAMHTFFTAKIDTQEERNRFLKGEIAKLDKEIAEINKLKDDIQVGRLARAHHFRPDRQARGFRQECRARCRGWPRQARAVNSGQHVPEFLELAL